VTAEDEPRSRNPLRRLYQWTVAWAHHPSGSAALFVIALVEACVFPIPPDVLLIALSVGRPKRALWFALVCTAGSLVGGVLGYLIGYGIGEAVVGTWLIPQSLFDQYQPMVSDNAFWIVFVSAFTPIPYKICTVLSGLLQVNFMVFLAASAIGRPARFFLVGGALFAFGARMRPWIERYLELVTIILVILLVGGYILVTQVF
jgi:membrane protein YqaA with SNARE-associated domain